MFINTASCNAEDEIELDNGSEVKDVQVKCNYKFMLDALNQVKDKETFTMEISDDSRVCNIKTDDEQFVHPICLMNTSS